jgi:hypothetical protein
MMLGDILSRLTDDGQATEIILDAGDLPLLAAMRAHAEAAGLDLATFARSALQRYAAEASDEEWITLMGLIGRTSDPGQVCLKRAFNNALRA